MSTIGYAHLGTDSLVPLAEGGSGSAFGSVSLLGSATGIDFKTASQTTLYTVPSGKTLFITEVVVEVTSVSTVTIPPIFSVGKTPSYDQWIAGVTPNAAIAASEKFTLMSNVSPTFVYSAFDAGDVVKFNVATGATATTLSGSVYLLGFLI